MKKYKPQMKKDEPNWEWFGIGKEPTKSKMNKSLSKLLKSISEHQPRK